jgi:two-component system, NarL family, response regulator NreC
VTVRVLIVDDQPGVRAGLRLVVDGETDLEAVAEAGSLRDAVFEARTVDPTVAVIGTAAPVTTAIEELPKLLYEHPELKVLILSGDDDPEDVLEAFTAGISGYVLKDAADSELVEAIREVAGGGRYIHPELGARVLAAESEAQRHAAEDPLSRREREVFALLARGFTNREIAQHLHISVRTAETHRAHVLQKLSLETRAELVSYALANGLLRS